MKYLKLFEGDGNEYYTKIPFIEWKELVSPVDQQCNKSLDIVDDFNKLVTKKGFHVEMNLSTDRRSIWGIIHKGHNGTTKWNFSICKIDDDWYLYSERRNYRGVYTHYKCDQWEGLLELLKDKWKR
jgi:hypothetical protein